MKTRLFRIGMGLVILLVLSGCKPAPSSFSISSDAGCQPPCWQNIIPGVTTKEDALSILRSLSTIDPGSISTRGSSWNIFSDIIYSSFLTGESGEFWIINDKVALMTFNGDLGVTFGEAIKQFGEPEYILVFGTIGDGPLWAHDIHTIVYAISPQTGILFGYDAYNAPRRWQSEIRAEIELDQIFLFDPDAFDQLADSGTFSMGNANAVQTRNAMHPWNGYGEIEKKYPRAHR